MTIFNLINSPQSPSPNHRKESRIGPYLAALIPQFVTALIVYGLRMYTRLRPSYRLDWSDHAMTATVVLLILEFSLAMYATRLGAGHHVQDVPFNMLFELIKLGIIAQIIWIWAAAMVKVSIACLILRLKGQSRVWKWSMIATISIILVSSIVISVLQLTDCRPIQANWNRAMANAKCVTEEDTRRRVYGTIAFFFATDVILALIPLAFIPQMNRPLRERIVVGILMCAGLFAALTNIPKFILIRKYLGAADFTWYLIPLSIWTHTELFVGVIAACVPMLKNLAQSTVRRVGAEVAGKGGGASAGSKGRSFKPGASDGSTTLRGSVLDGHELEMAGWKKDDGEAGGPECHHRAEKWSEYDGGGGDGDEEAGSTVHIVPKVTDEGVSGSRRISGGGVLGAAGRHAEEDEEHRYPQPSRTPTSSSRGAQSSYEEEHEAVMARIHLM